MNNIPETTAHKYQNLINFISDCDACFSFLHTTNSLEKAMSICKNGFVFSQFDKTTDYVCDIVSLTYMLNIRKHYGDFTIILQLSNQIKSYTEISIKEYDVEGEEVFILPPRYVKGFYNRNTREIFLNPLYIS
jgi:hypothetical protein